MFERSLFNPFVSTPQVMCKRVLVFLFLHFEISGHTMDQKILSLLENVSNAVGVYFLYDKDDRLIYIGKSKHIRTRLIQHFKSDAYREVRIREELARIDYEVMGDETIALLHESDLIKLHQPKYNRALRKTKFSYGLYMRTDACGYYSLYVDKIDPLKNEIVSFSSFREGKERLFAITERYQLCQKINGLYNTKGSCFQYQLKACNGACINKEKPLFYNERVNLFVQTTELPLGDQFIEVEGRQEDEKGLIFIKDGTYKGFGYCKKTSKSKNVYLKNIVLKEDNRDSRRIVKRLLLQMPNG